MMPLSFDIMKFCGTVGQELLDCVRGFIVQAGVVNNNPICRYNQWKMKMPPLLLLLLLLQLRRISVTEC